MLRRAEHGSIQKPAKPMLVRLRNHLLSHPCANRVLWRKQLARKYLDAPVIGNIARAVKPAGQFQQPRRARSARTINLYIGRILRQLKAIPAWRPRQASRSVSSRAGARIARYGRKVIPVCQEKNPGESVGPRQRPRGHWQKWRAARGM